MIKEDVLREIQQQEDSIVELWNGECFACTLNFKTKYIKQIRKKKKEKFNFGGYSKNDLLVFSWTDNKFRKLNALEVKSITPLNEEVYGTSKVSK